MMMNGRERQKEESRRMIEEALFELMKEEEFSRITVVQIAERADVARRTFYRMYESKEDVLHRCFGRLCQEYKADCKVLSSYDLRQISRDFFGFWYRYRELLLLLDSCGLDTMLYCEMSRVSSEIIRQRTGSEAMKSRPGLAYFADYSAGGFINLLRSWVAGGMRKNADEYAERVSTALLTVMNDGKIQDDEDIQT